VNLDGVAFSKIDNADNEILCREFSEHEILEVVGQCGSNKSPGPDCYNFRYIKNKWDIIGVDMINVIHCFYVSGYILKGCNASFISLVPKKVNPTSFNEYRPISLVGCVYKLIVKLLANRLRRVPPKVIDKHQTFFVSGRGMMDSVLIANETMNFLKKENLKAVIVKVDYGKAFDLVDWDFFIYMMERMGFSVKWIKWIKTCLTSATISVFD